ncbi:RAMP superfamily CRISPR-associated protein [Thermogutta sp.]|uniref:RAMP superfamily CRISPR-associated protein n=1 Tax=Thermogutta sp. TaxID=1962930 RepID=UPI00322059CB
MTTEFVLTLQLRAPLALHQTRAGVQYVGTLDYIPGTALRGALAEAYLAEHGMPDDTFRALFLSEQVQYGDLWPAVEGERTLLLPATARACKRHGLSHPASFRDALLDVLGKPEGEEKCPSPNCGESLDRVSGYLSGLEPVAALSPRSRLRVNTAIERSTGTVAREMLFTQHTLIGRRKIQDRSEPILFQGPVRLADLSLKDSLETLLQVPLFLGAGRSRGLGQVEVKAWEEAPAGEPLAERWRKFNEAAHRAGGDPRKRYFSLTLLSHLALRDDLLRPVLDRITPQHFGLPDGVAWVRYPDSERAVLFLSAVTVPGWNAALGLPKPDTVALARGSVLLGECDAAQEQAILTRLTEIEAEGVGERRSEGFGRVAGCYPIHYECWR